MEHEAVGFSPEITFFIPCMNERKHSYDTIETIYNTCINIAPFEIIAVDDGSTDGTFESLLRAQQNHRNVPITILRNGINRGVGFSFLLAAIHGRGKWIIYIPGDNVVLVESLRAILEKRHDKDIVIPHHSGSMDPRSRNRVVISRLFTTVVNLISGNKILYYNGSVLFPREVISQIPIYFSSPAYQSEIICRLFYEGFKYVHVHVPILEHGHEERGREQSAILKFKNIFPVSRTLLNIMFSRVYRKIEKRKSIKENNNE
ncbi:MAG: glycosyltransferase family 2 protein [Nitrospirae bacterium]|nr:glycosyltransferase family 2 protein [Magnetococcales bacterium]HAT51026.1 hypothetical protein [Alphaproteobacteria bacterium]